MLQQPVMLSFRYKPSGSHWGNHHQGGFAHVQFKLGIGEAFKGPFAESFEPSNKTEELLVQALQLLEGLEVGATSCADSGTIKDLLLKVYQQLERLSDEPVQ